MDALPIGITPIKITELFGGACWLYRFDNGYGASVALHGMSYGHEDAQFELLLTKFTFPHGSSWGQPDVAMIESISQSEPGGDDHGLWGWLTIEDVARILGAVRGYQTPRRAVLERHHLTDGEWTGSYIGSW
jgi:hypothetical protein